MHEGEDQVSLFAEQLRHCRDFGCESQCLKLHAEILESPHHRNRFLRNLLVEMYGGCGSVGRAREVFDSIDSPNLYSWNIMLKVYAQNGFSDQALRLYMRIDCSETLAPDAYTFASVLGAVSDLDLGKEIHSRITSRSLEENVIVGTGLINMYSRCGSVKVAREVFDRMREPNAVAWTSIITAYAQTGNTIEAKNLFERMPEPKQFAQNVMITTLSESGEIDEAKSLFDSLPQPDVVASTSMFVAYARHGDLHESRKLFDQMTERNLVSWNAMLTAYARMGDLTQARLLFNKMPSRDTVSWTCIISAYTRCRDLLEARNLFDRMKDRDVVSWNTMLAGYSFNGEADQAKELFDQIPSPDVVSWNTLLAAYALHGRNSEAEILFSKMPLRDVVSWNTMLTSLAFNWKLEQAKLMFEEMPIKNLVSWNIMVVTFAEAGRAKEAVQLVARMDSEGFHTDKYTFISIFNACTGVAAANDGKTVHLSIVEAGLLFDIALGDSLVNMYAKCGSLQDARALFDEQISKGGANVEAWNAMMAACSQAGVGAEAVNLFRSLDLQGLEPNDVSFIRVLSACSHAGLMSDARLYFASISNDYSAEVTMDHYLCMVDMLGRTGKLEQAKELLETMPYEPNIIAWMTLLSACSNHGNSDDGIKSAGRILELEPQTSAPFILLSNIYRQLGGLPLRRESLRRRLENELHSGIKCCCSMPAGSKISSSVNSLFLRAHL